MRYGKASERLYRPAPSVYNGPRGDPLKISSSPRAILYTSLFTSFVYQAPHILPTCELNIQASLPAPVLIYFQKDKWNFLRQIWRAFPNNLLSLPIQEILPLNNAQRNGSGIVVHPPHPGICHDKYQLNIAIVWWWVHHLKAEEQVLNMVTFILGLISTPSVNMFRVMDLKLLLITSLILLWKSSKSHDYFSSEWIC